MGSQRHSSDHLRHMKRNLLLVMVLAVNIILLPLILWAGIAHAVPTKMQAKRWYRRSDTQCVVTAESKDNTWTAVSSDGTYRGRFQMDYSFETETPYGRWAERRWGRSDNWPPIVQIIHALEVWLYAGWSRWPTYYRYCA